MKYEFSLANGTFTEGGSGVTQTGTRNDTALHFIYVSFTQVSAGKLSIQYKESGSSDWRSLGRVDLSGADVAEFKVPTITTGYRFIVEGLSGSGFVEVTDEPVKQDIHPMSFFGETGGMTPEEIGQAIQDAAAGGGLTEQEVRDIADEQIESSSTINDAVNSAVAAIDFNAAAEDQFRKSLRFYERNMQTNITRNSVIQQSKTGVPNFFIRGDTTLVRFTINRESTVGNYSQYLIETGDSSLGNTFRVVFYSSNNNVNVSARKRIEVKVNIGAGGSFTILTSELPDSYERDFLLAIGVDASGNVAVNVVSCITGLVVASGSGTTTSTAGIPYRGDGFVISKGITGAGIFESVLTPNNSGLCGALAEIAIARELYDDTQLGNIARFGIKSVATETALYYYRNTSDTNWKVASATNDSSVDTVVVGEEYLELGSTIGFADTFTVKRKPVGFIAGIEPGGNSKELTFEFVTDNSVAGEVEYRIRCAGSYVKNWSVCGAVEAGTSEYDITIQLPVTSDWCQIEFRIGSDVYYYNDPIAAGVKAHCVGQSQMTYLQSYEASAGVVRTVNSPASYATEEYDLGWPHASIYRLDEQVCKDGVAGFAHHFSRNSNVPVCFIINAVPGTGVEEWADDSLTDRQWLWTQKLIDVAGNDVSCHVWQWGTNNLVADYGDEIFRAIVKGVLTTDVPVLDHYVYDGVTFDRDAVFILSPLTGHRSVTVDADGTDTDTATPGVGACRAAQIAWAEENGVVVGPFINDLPTGGPHPYTETPKSTWRFGIRIAEAVLRGMKLSDRKNPTIKSVKWVGASRNQIDIEFDLKNRGALQTDGGDPKWNFEFDDGAGLTNKGFTAAIINPVTVRLTKDTGNWSDTVDIYFQQNGPFGYGVSAAGTMDPLELEIVSGALFDGVGMDGTVPGDSLGTPIASVNTAYSVS